MSVLSVCLAARKITDEELSEMERMAKGQMDYFSPLKMATMTRQRALGQHNLNVLQKLRDLRDTIKVGERIAPKRKPNASTR